MPSSLFPQTNNNPMQLIAEFKKFMASGITPEKAEQIVKEKISNGEISQAQLEQLKEKATQFQNMMQLFK